MDWTLEEVELIVADYFAMLESELRGVAFNKAARNRALRTLLPRRSRSSVEFKHRNISAVLVSHDLPYITGYLPAQNSQKLLERVVLERFEADAAFPEWAAASETFVVSQPQESDFADLAELEEAPPEPSNVPNQAQERRIVRVDFVARDAQNRRLGRLGEEWALEFEARRLHDIERRPDLSSMIRHVSALDGDGAGYDIASFDADGSPRLIEVKTTGLGKSFPFYVSANEVAVSARNPDRYQLYRVFEFSKQPKVFRLLGALGTSCRIEPVQYRARV